MQREKKIFIGNILARSLYKIMNDPLKNVQTNNGNLMKINNKQMIYRHHLHFSIVVIISN